MGAKDADLASADKEELFISDGGLGANLAIELTTSPHPPTHIEVFLTSATPGGVGGGPLYRMRGYDSDLGYPVYWDSVIVDTAGVDYPGNSAALSDVVVSEVIAG